MLEKSKKRKPDGFVGLSFLRRALPLAVSGPLFPDRDHDLAVIVSVLAGIDVDHVCIVRERFVPGLREPFALDLFDRLLTRVVARSPATAEYRPQHFGVLNGVEIGDVSGVFPLYANDRISGILFPK